LGENGSGKTNFFEAAGVCATGKSVRGASLREMVCAEEKETGISANFLDGDEKISQSVGFSKSNEIFISINDVKYKTFSSLYGKNGFVYFGVDDTKTVNGIPQEKRQFLDMTISQTNGEYLQNIIKYRNLIRQRNFIINEKFNEDLLDIYDVQIAEIAVNIIRERKNFFADVAPVCEKIYEEISNGDLSVNLQYLPSINCENKEEYYKIQKENLTKDREQKFTTSGVHRDNFEFKTANTKLTNFGSQGQCKSAAISLKVAVVQYLSKSNRKTIIVIDDAFSDLDISRKKKFFEILNKKGQIFIAVHSFEELDYYPLENYFEIKEGNMKCFQK